VDIAHPVPPRSPHVAGRATTEDDVSQPPTHRVVIVGGGFGGLFATRFLKRADVQVTLLDRVNYHLFQPLLYQVATGILSEGQIAPPIRQILRRQRNVTVAMATVTGFDLDGRVVSATAPDGAVHNYPYDSLIVAAGAGQSYFGHDEYSRWAPGMKTIDDALELRGRIFGAFELAETEPDPDIRRGWLTFLVVGGGPTGVEIAGQIAELARHALKDNFRSIDPATAKVLLYDGGKEVLATFGDELSKKAAAELERLGVVINCGRVVTGIDAFGADVKAPDGTVERVDARTKVWAAGVEASPLARLLAKASGAECDRAGRIAVLPDCTLPGHPEVFAVGDMMALNKLPGVAEVAMQSGIHAGHTIKRRLKGQEAVPFTYRDLGSMATISRFRAVVSFKGLRLSGFPGWLMWLVVHITFLTGFRNRGQALLHWINTFIGGGRAERTITIHQVAGRVAFEAAGGDAALTEMYAKEREASRKPDS
jgi:NADH:ubiquinone reductase (H+-translocating)